MWGWVVLALVLVGIAVGYAVSRIALGYPAPRTRYRRLGRGEAAFLAGAAEATYPEGGTLPFSGRDADLPGYVDRLLDASYPRTRVLMHLLIFLVEHATLFFPAPGRRGRRRFSALDAEQQVAVLDAWATSRWYARRLVFMSLRAILTMAYFAYPPLLRQLRLAPYAFDTPVCEADLWYPPIGKGPDAVRVTRADLTPPSDGVPLDLEGPLLPGYAEEQA